MLVLRQIASAKKYANFGDGFRETLLTTKLIADRDVL